MEVLPKGTTEVLTSSQEVESIDEESSETESDESGIFGMADMTAELSACEE